MLKFLTASAVSARPLLAVFIATAFATPVVHAQGTVAPKPSVFVTVNGATQSLENAKILIGEQMARGAPNSPQLQNSVREVLIAQALMSGEATKLGLDKQPVVRAQLDLARQNVLAQAWQAKVIEENPVTDKDIEAEYKRQTDLLGKQEVRIRHLMVGEEPTAVLLMEKIQSGAKIADLAAQYTRDEPTRQTGGLTGWIPAGQLSPALADAVKDLAPGKMAPKVVKGAAGWHVVQLEERRAYTPPTLEDSKPQLTQAVVQQRIQDRLSKMRQSAKVE